MIEELATLVPALRQGLWHGFIVFIRVATVVALLPAFGEQSVPSRVKLVIALAFALIVAPAVPKSGATPSIESVPWLAITEVVAGLIIGLGLRLFILALQTAGSIAAQSTSLSQILGGAVADPLPALGYTLIIGGLALAVILGLHIKATMMMIHSYEMIPIGVLPDGSVISEWGVRQISRSFELAFTLAAPFLIVSILYNFALGAINKAMPQLMVAFVGAPVITFAGLFILFLAAPVILTTWIQTMDGFLADPFLVRP